MKNLLVEQFVARALAIVEQEEAGTIAYLARAMIQATMPHSKPSELSFTRKNGSYSLSMTADRRWGLPYGSIPRLLLCWMTGEAVRTRESTLTLGGSLSEFMHRLGLGVTGGGQGTIKRLKDQLMRLFTTSVSCVYDTREETAGLNFFIAEKYQLWWMPKTSEQPSLWNSEVTLSRPFFNEIVNAPVPIRLDTLRLLQSSSLALDVYCWCTYRNSYAKKESAIPYVALQNQFGAGYPATSQGRRDFKKKFLLALKKVSLAYPEAGRLRAEEDVLVFVPGRPDVPPRDGRN